MFLDFGCPRNNVTSVVCTQGQQPSLTVDVLDNPIHIYPPMFLTVAREETKKTWSNHVHTRTAATMICHRLICHYGSKLKWRIHTYPQQKGLFSYLFHVILHHLAAHHAAQQSETWGPCVWYHQILRDQTPETRGGAQKRRHTPKKIISKLSRFSHDHLKT